MKATRLRVGFAATVALALLLTVFVPASFADGTDLEAALDAYALNKNDEALEKLRAYVKSDPSAEEVYAVLRKVKEVLLLNAMARGGEHEDLIKFLLEKASPKAADPMDAETIKSKVEQAINGGDVNDRLRARTELRAAGELAVPHLVPYLGSEDDAQVVNAILALQRLGTAATLPLVEALASDDARVRGHAASILGHSKDPRAGPALLAATADKEEAVANKARDAANSLGVSGSAVQAYVDIGTRYYDGDPQVTQAFNKSMNIWTWKDGGLSSREVPATFYGNQMAEEAAADALAIDPKHEAARVLLVRALLAQKSKSEESAEEGKEAPAELSDADALARSQGFDAAAGALAESLDSDDWEVAAKSLGLMAQNYAGQSIDDTSLPAALESGDKRVRYAAAAAALHMSPTMEFRNAFLVAGIAAQAVGGGAIRQALVIDDVEESRSALLAVIADAGLIVGSEKNGAIGANRAKSAPTMDVIIIRANLGENADTLGSQRHDSSLSTIEELSKDARTQDMRILVLIDETGDRAATLKEFFSSRFGEDIAGFLEVPLVDGVVASSVKDAANAGDPGPDQKRANEAAAAAAGAFAATKTDNDVFDLTAAVGPLATAVAEGPTEAIKMAAIKALGNIKSGGGDALLGVLTGGADDMKAAAASALGNVLSAVDGTTEQIDGLMAASQGDSDLAKAALAALGKVRNLSAEQMRDVFHRHRKLIGD